MKKSLTIIAAVLAGLVVSAGAAAQEKPKDAATMAAESADYLQRMLDLEDYQVFLVDSTLQYNYDGMLKGIEAVRRQKATNSDLYQRVTDKWSEANDTTFFKIFSPEQWKKYMRTSFGKEKKAREKRQAKRAR
ncbi:MAG: hypothetical protein J5699_04250 [Bacteroidales bacterium]|nr:hypothetical protein [Bacteroidales bacterium]